MSTYHNVDNHGTLTGRILTKDLSKGIFMNKDGSYKIRFTVGVMDAFSHRGCEPSSQSIPVEGFVPAKVVKVNPDGTLYLGVYSTLRTGEMVTIGYHIEDNTYTDHDGMKVYGGIILRIDQLKHREAKSYVDAREARKSA